MDKTYFKKIAELRGYTKRAADPNPVKGEDYQMVQPEFEVVDNRIKPPEETNKSQYEGPNYRDSSKAMQATADQAMDKWSKATAKLLPGTLTFGGAGSAAAAAIYAAVQKLRGKKIKAGGLIGNALGGFGVGAGTAVGINGLKNDAENFKNFKQSAKDWWAAAKDAEMSKNKGKLK